MGRPDTDDPFISLQREMNRLFEDAFRSVPAVTSNGKAFLSPSVDVKETEKAVEVTAELPGIDDKDVEVRFENDILTLKGEKKAEKTEDKEGYRVSERSYGMFERSWQVPGIDADKITANVTKGVLTVTLPKRADAKPSAKKIEIKSAA
jgi:HSP20 family protein